MKIEFIYFMVLWLNAFPVKNGISSVFSPRKLLVQWRMDYSKHCRVLPGTYCKVHDEASPSNTMTPRTHKVTAMGPTGNLQGMVKFFCLNTGRILKQQSFTALHMPDRVIKHANPTGLRKKQGQAFQFLNRRQDRTNGRTRYRRMIQNFKGSSRTTKKRHILTSAQSLLEWNSSEKRRIMRQ
jgi:hypothetical protein